MTWCELCGEPLYSHDRSCPRYSSGSTGLLQINTKITPVPKPRMTRSDRWNERPCVLRYFAFKDELLLRAKEQGYRDDLDVFHISAVANIPMPKSWTKKKKAQLVGEPHRQKPDADNILKAVCDALLKDDSKVWAKEVRKYWSKEPGLYIFVYYYDGKEHR